MVYPLRISGYLSITKLFKSIEAKISDDEFIESKSLTLEQITDIMYEKNKLH